MIQNVQKIKTRRDFLRDGMRTVLLSGIGFMGLFLGWKGYSNSGKESSCLVNLPCRGCSRLSGCREPKALDVKQKERDYRLQSSRMNSGGDGVR